MGRYMALPAQFCCSTAILSATGWHLIQTVPSPTVASCPTRRGTIVCSISQQGRVEPVRYSLSHPVSTTSPVERVPAACLNQLCVTHPPPTQWVDCAVKRSNKQQNLLSEESQFYSQLMVQTAVSRRATEYKWQLQKLGEERKKNIFKQKKLWEESCPMGSLSK